MGLLWAALGCFGLALDYFGLSCAVQGCFGVLWFALDCSGLFWVLSLKDVRGCRPLPWPPRCILDRFVTECALKKLSIHLYVLTEQLPVAFNRFP